jgi:acetylornithine deacetylase/succinyl-diaminopimelate desuccinylase-like protein
MKNPYNPFNDNMKNYFEENKNKNLDELIEFLSIPSISALSENKADVRAAAIWLQMKFQSMGLENIEIIETEGHPIVYADYLHAEGKATVLVYGHYDVQPVDPLDLWITPPFKPDIRDGKIYARGATDDKGQIFLHIKVVESFLQKIGTLPVNIKFCIEGEEEIGSPHLPAYLSEHAEKLKADVVLISDTSLFDKGIPAICTALRGLCSLQIDLKTANTDLHSGVYGGGVPNALHALVELLASFHDKQGSIQVNGFYDDVLPLTEQTREEFASIPFDEGSLLERLELDSLHGEAGYSFTERTGARPTLEINGIFGGFQGEGIKTVLPCEAHAKITCRLVSGQTPEDILEKLEQHIKMHTPIGAKITTTHHDKGNPFWMDTNSPMLLKASAAYESVYGIKPVYIRGGGSIPIVEAFSRILATPVVLMGFGLPEENLHAPNEHFHVENFDLGLLTICQFYEEICR